MGTGYHGGFGNTTGSSKKVTFKKIYYEGSVKVNGIERDISRKVYQRNDIDFNYFDKKSQKTNLELMLAGRPPIGNDGKPIELHHILQKESGPMVEIRETTHREYKKTLHGLIQNGDSFRNNDDLEKQYNNFRKQYWKNRAKKYLEGK